MGIESRYCPDYLLYAAREEADRAIQLGERHGFRNAQVTVIAPTGTIGLLMDCDTTGIEPDFSLVKFKKLAGGGYFKIINQSIPPALRKLGYSELQVQEIIRYCVGSQSLVGCQHVNQDTLHERGFSDEILAKIESALPGAFDIRFVINPYTIARNSAAKSLN